MGIKTRMAGKLRKTVKARSPQVAAERAKAAYRVPKGNATLYHRVHGADNAAKKAYRDQFTKNVKMGALLGAGAILYPSTGQTGPNQGTFARRGVQNRRTVGISSGAIQNVHATSMYGSIGGM